MIGYVLLGLLGVALVANIVDDDDDDEVVAETPETDDRVSGSDDPETLQTEGGDDTVFAGGGNDLIDAGDGNDRVFGQDGTDVIVGGEGDDFLRGSAGDDVIFADEGEDTLFGDAGDDVLFGADIIDTEAVFEETAQTNFLPFSFLPFFDVNGDTGEADELNGGVGEDVLVAGSNDIVSTGDGEDAVEIGDWVIPGQPVVVTDFDPAEDVIIYDYVGDTEPDIVIGEDEDTGDATIEIAVTGQDNQVVATLNGVDFFDVSTSNIFLLQIT